MPLSKLHQQSTGLDVSNTKLTACNSTQIPHYGSPDIPITWQPWCNPFLDQLLLLCGRHTQSGHPWPPIMWKLRSYEDELCHHSHPEHFQASESCCSTNNTSTQKKTNSIRSADDCIKEFPDRFQGICHFPSSYIIRLHDDACPIIHVPRKCPISICPKDKAELERMVKFSAVTPVDLPMDWVSSAAYTWKESGELCLSLNPHDLNQAIHQDHQKTPTVREVTHEFKHPCFFTKLDAHHRCWAIILDDGSRLLTTSNSSFG